jgi:carboxyl-terminal processing protease
MSRRSTAFTVLLLGCVGASFAQTRHADTRTLFQAVWEIVDAHFYDSEFNGLDWQAVRDEYEPRVLAASSDEARVDLIRDMLRKLHASHTELLTPEEPRFYHLLSVFEDKSAARGPAGAARSAGVSYTGVGWFLSVIDGKTFVKAVWDGFPAAQAGLHAGDEILAADRQPLHPIESFRGKAGKPVRLRIQTSPDPASARDVDVVPVEIHPTDAFLDAQLRSWRIFKRPEGRIGYIHIWSYAARASQELLVAMTTGWPLKPVDALIVDLREGLGGADPDYLNLFNRAVPLMEFISRTGEVASLDTQWRKPAALLINEGTTSGKEIFARGFQKYGRGKLVGNRTAGALLGGRLFHMPGGNLLYLAVADVRCDGERLEGVGVTPDVQVPFDVRYSGGRDPQLERAIDLLAQEIAGAKP